MVCEKMLFLFLLGTFVTVLFCHFPFDCTFSGYSTQWSVGTEGLEVWNVSVGGARGPAEPAGPARARGVFGLVGDLSRGRTVTLGCPRKLGSMVSKWVITPIITHL